MRLSSLLFPLAILLALATATGAETRVALVIGNAAYEQENAALKNPVNDAAAVAAALRRMDFEVIEGTNLDEEGFYDKIAAFDSAAHSATTALFFYAGHGLQVDGRNYLAPVDMKLERKQDLRRYAIELAAVLEVMHSETNLVILDACRNNPMAGELARAIGMTRAAAASRGLARVEETRDMLIAYATAPDDVAADGTGEHSPYTEALLEHMETPGLSVQNMFTHVTGSVEKRTGGKQRPWTNTSLTKVVHLVPAVAPARARWEVIKDSNDPSVLRDFITQFPGSQFAELAQDKLSELAQIRWQSIKGTDNRAALLEFRTAFPGSPFDEAAKAALARLQQLEQVRRCSEHLQAEQLDSAARCYREVLRGDPDHELAKEGLGAVADAYSRAGKDALRQGKELALAYEDVVRQVEGHLEKLRDTDAGHPSIVDLREALRGLRLRDAGELESLRSENRQLRAAARQWVRVQESSQPADFEAFLGTHGKSHFAGAARRRLQELREARRLWEQVRESTEPADFEAFLREVLKGRMAVQGLEQWKALLEQNGPEVAAWERVRNSTRLSDLEDFLGRYPTGRFAAAARRRLAELQVTAALAECAAHLRANRLTTGIGGTALGCYQEVLRKAPGNRPALEGLEAIAERYREWAKAAIEGSNWQRGRMYLEKLQMVNADHPELAVLETRLESMQAEAARQEAEAQARLQLEAEQEKKRQQAEEERLRLEREALAEAERKKHEQALEQARLEAEAHKTAAEQVAQLADQRPPQQETVQQRPQGGARQKLDKSLVMVRVAGGRFNMGCQSKRDGPCVPQEKPAHEVQVHSFEIGKYEVTQALWEKVMGDNPSWFDGCAECPVGRVSWHDVQAFIGKLNGRTGEQYRLPTEAEWEYAARGGQQSQGFRYAGSNSQRAVAWYTSDSSGRKVHPVGQKQANELGLHDMSGNVKEWVRDCWNANYNKAPGNGRAWEGGDCGRRVVRGGAYFYTARVLRSAWRDGNFAKERYNLVGFRLARTLSP